MTYNHIKLNCVKTECLWIMLRHRSKSFTATVLSFDGTIIETTAGTHKLGIHFDINWISNSTSPMYVVHAICNFVNCMLFVDRYHAMFCKLCCYFVNLDIRKRERERKLGDGLVTSEIFSIEKCFFRK